MFQIPAQFLSMTRPEKRQRAVMYCAKQCFDARAPVLFACHVVRLSSEGHVYMQMHKHGSIMTEEGSDRGNTSEEDSMPIEQFS